VTGDGIPWRSANNIDGLRPNTPSALIGHFIVAPRDPGLRRDAGARPSTVDFLVYPRCRRSRRRGLAVGALGAISAQPPELSAPTARPTGFLRWASGSFPRVANTPRFPGRRATGGLNPLGDVGYPGGRNEANDGKG